MALDIIPLHPEFGARVGNLDVRLPVDADTAQCLRSAFEKFSLLLFPGEETTQEHQVLLSQIFGDVEPVKIGSLGAGTPVSTLTNILADGRLAPVDDKKILVTRANQLWHSDGSYKQSPPLASSILAHIVPPEGGETDFMSMRSVYKSLPGELRESIDSAYSVHSYATSRDSISPKLMSDAERRVLPAVEQPLITVNPTNGQKALFVGSHMSHIIGLSSEESANLVTVLRKHASNPDFVYQHHWTPNDIILWDNRCVNHRGRPWAVDRHPRRLTHTAISART